MFSNLTDLTCIVTGASSGIGLAAVRLLLDGSVTGLAAGRVHALARHALASLELEELTAQHGDRLCRWSIDLTRPEELAGFAAGLQERKERPALVFNAAGLLHGPDLQPEKSVSQIRIESLQAVFAINAFAPILLAQALLPLLRQRGPVVFASLSARVGSIGDNRLGGWYAYRASKAAQNQLIRTLAVELSRLNPQSCCLLLHPGTVDTPLSTPFQAGVADDKLFSPERAARQLLQLVANAEPADSGRFLAWDGSAVPW
jgi:NAD(P)-dependent dehydrogenase (short-subunit alcohol dehydrogenase family)